MKRVNAGARTAVVCWDPSAEGAPAEAQEVSCYALRVRAAARPRPDTVTSDSLWRDRRLVSFGIIPRYPGPCRRWSGLLGRLHMLRQFNGTSRRSSSGMSQHLASTRCVGTLNDRHFDASAAPRRLQFRARRHRDPARG